MGKRRQKNVWHEDSPRGSHASPDSETPESSSDRVLVNIGRAMFVSLGLIALGFAICATYLGVTSNPWNFAWAVGGLSRRRVAFVDGGLWTVERPVGEFHALTLGRRSLVLGLLGLVVLSGAGVAGGAI